MSVKDCESRMMHVIDCLKDAESAVYLGMRALRDSKVNQAYNALESALYQLRTVGLGGEQESNEAMAERAASNRNTIKQAEDPYDAPEYLKRQAE